MDKRILVVDFEARDLGSLERALRSEGLVALPARDREEALERWREAPADAVLLAVDDRQRRHVEVVRAIRGVAEGVPILFFGPGEPTASVRAPSEALVHGGDYFFRLPCDLAYLAGRARAWAERGSVQNEALPAPSVEPEAPDLEGFGYERTGFSIPPLLNRLRQPDPSAMGRAESDWSWVAELDRSEVLDELDFVPPAGALPSSRDLDPDEAHPGSPPPAEGSEAPPPLESPPAASPEPLSAPRAVVAPSHPESVAPPHAGGRPVSSDARPAPGAPPRVAGPDAPSAADGRDARPEPGAPPRVAGPDARSAAEGGDARPEPGAPPRVAGPDAPSAADGRDARPEPGAPPLAVGFDARPGPAATSQADVDALVAALDDGAPPPPTSFDALPAAPTARAGDRHPLDEVHIEDVDELEDLVEPTAGPEPLARIPLGRSRRAPVWPATVERREPGASLASDAEALPLEPPETSTRAGVPSPLPPQAPAPEIPERSAVAVPPGEEPAEMWEEDDHWAPPVSARGAPRPATEPAEDAVDLRPAPASADAASAPGLDLRPPRAARPATDDAPSDLRAPRPAPDLRVDLDPRQRNAAPVAEASSTAEAEELDFEGPESTPASRPARAPASALRRSAAARLDGDAPRTVAFRPVSGHEAERVVAGRPRRGSARGLPDAALAALEALVRDDRPNGAAPSSVAPPEASGAHERPEASEVRSAASASPTGEKRRGVDAGASGGREPAPEADPASPPPSRPRDHGDASARGVGSVPSASSPAAAPEDSWGEERTLLHDEVCPAASRDWPVRPVKQPVASDAGSPLASAPEDETGASVPARRLPVSSQATMRCPEDETGASVPARRAAAPRAAAPARGDVSSNPDISAGEDAPAGEDTLRARRRRRRAARLERALEAESASEPPASAPEVIESFPFGTFTAEDQSPITEDIPPPVAAAPEEVDAMPEEAGSRDRGARSEGAGETRPVEASRVDSLPPDGLVAACPASPIGDDEDTQELYVQPIVAAAGGDDFPPGALAIVGQAEEALRARGARDEACGGLALAAQIYLEHGMTTAAAALYGRMLELRPEDPLATARLRELQSASGESAEPSSVVEDLVLEPARASDAPAASAQAPAAEPSSPSKRRRPSPLGRLLPSGLDPTSGQLSGVSDVVELFLRARAQRCTGVLELFPAAGLLFAHGVPAGLVGDDVIPSFLRLTADIGRISEGHARTLARADFPSPRALARKLQARGVLDADDERLLILRHLEDRLVRVLQHRGGWSFSEDTRGLGTADLVLRDGELRDWLVDLLPRAAGVEELRSALDLGDDVVRLVPGTEHFVSDLDAPLAELLDGRRGIEEAARLAGVPAARALAWALVWSREGLVERSARAPRVTRAPSPAARREMGAPTLADLPPLRPRSRRARSPWPRSFRLERDRRASASDGEGRVDRRRGGEGPNDAAPLEDLPPGLADRGREAPSSPELEDLDAENRLRALAELVRTRDYFGILSVDPSASGQTIDDAHRRMRSLVPDEVSAELEAMAREVLRSVDEARDILMIPELRAAYEQHLGPRAL